MSERVLDCKDMRCPMPIVRLGQEVKLMNAGDKIIIHSDDCAFQADINAWIKHTGNELVGVEIKDEVYSATIIKR